MTLLIIGIILIGLYFAVQRISKRYYRYREGRDIIIPEPSIKRQDIYYAYYAAAEKQVSETKDHTNLFWSIFFEGMEGLVSNIKEANQPTVLCLSYQLLKRNDKDKWILQENAEKNLEELFSRLQQEGILDKLIATTIADEPNSLCDSLQVWLDATDIVNRVSKKFPELANLKHLMLLNGGASDQELKTWVPYADLVGFDLYKKLSDILSPKRWPNPGGLQVQLESWLRPDQQTFLVPGGCYGQDPTPFINYAHSNPKVWAVIVFLWLDTNDPSVEGCPGIRSGGKNGKMKEIYIDAGHRVMNK